jgi:pSer/pThr/pTyr-binding forkhead associated (FHA) protein
MSTLTLRFGETVKGEYTLEKGESLTIGRRENNDVVIDNAAVSGAHGKIDGLDQGWLLTDLKSKNGTFVNGKLITSHWLKDADTITIGKHTLVFSLAEGESPPAGEESIDKTMVLDTDLHRFMKAESTGEMAGPKAKEEVTGTLSFLKGKEGEVTLSKKITKIGKDPLSDIVISGFMMGQTAATISKRPNGYYLSYVEGMTKPKVNGAKIKEAVRLKEFDVIEIGSTKMEFFLKG